MNGTVYLIDDDQANLEALDSALRSLNFATRTFTSAEAFLDSFDPNALGCVLTDLRLQGMSGMELMEALKHRGATTPVVIVTAFAKTPLTVRAMRRGAVSVLDKPVDPDQLWDTVHEAIRIDHDRKVKQAEALAIESRFRELTPQENLVLEMMIGGKTNREIASTLDVSTRTVEARRHNIFRKTQTDSVPDLVKLTLAFQQIA